MQVYNKGEHSGNVTVIHEFSDVVLSLTSYDQSSFNGFRHYHDYAHFSLVLQGGCLEKKTDIYERSTGKVTFYEAGEAHQVLRINRPSRHVNLDISPAFFDRYAISERELKNAAANYPDAALLLVEAYKGLIRTEPVNIDMLLLGMIKPLQRPTFPRWLTLVEAYLREHFNEQITLQDLARITQVHPVTISKYFPAYFNCTLSAYLRKLKIEKSLSLLKSPKFNLSEIAAACGFFDQSHFTRTFKEITGISPAVYQKL